MLQPVKQGYGLVRVLAGALLALHASLALAAAGGLALPDQSVKAGGAASAFGPTTQGDASAAFFNPAGLATVHKRQFNLGGTLILLDYEINGKGIFNPDQSRDKDVVPGDQSLNVTTLAAAPDTSLALPITDRLTFGISLNAPIGFIQHLPFKSSARYQAQSTIIVSQNVGPSLGWQVTDTLRVGAGVNIEFLFLKLANEVDAGTRAETQFDQDCPKIVNSTGSDVLGNLASQLNLGNVADGLIGGLPAAQVICGTTNTPGVIEPMGLAGDFDFGNKFRVHDFGFGYNLGLQWQATPTTLIGIHYTSKIKHDLHGRAERNNGGNLAYASKLENTDASDSALEQTLLSTREALTGFTAGDTYESQVVLRALQNSNNQHVRVDLTVPETVSAGIAQQLTPRLTVALNYAWTNWSRFDELRFHYTGSPRFFDNIFQQVAGRSLRPSERVDRRDNPTVQPLNFQDASRYGVGVNYHWNSWLDLRSGYSYTEPVVDDVTVTDRVRTPSGGTQEYTVGATYKPHPGLAIDTALGYTRIDGGAVKQTNLATRSLNRFDGKLSDVSLFTVGFTLRQTF